MEERKAKTHKGKLYLESLKGKINEDPKKTLFINTQNSSEMMRIAMNELYLMKKDYSKKLNKKENILNLTMNKDNIEFLCKKNNCQMFTITSDTKKHPMDISFGLLYNHEYLDTFEFEITNMIPSEYFKVDKIIDSDLKPVILFQGDLFETDYTYDRLKKFFIDYFQLEDKESVVISQLRRVIVLSIEKDEKIIKIRNYQINGNLLSKGNLDKIELVEIGPSFDFKERIFNLCDNELYKKSLKVPKQFREIKEKNIEKNKILGEKRGRLHLQKQNLTAVSLKKYKKILNKDKFGKTNKDLEEEPPELVDTTKITEEAGKKEKKTEKIKKNKKISKTLKNNIKTINLDENVQDVE